jgi:hypothetical protein
LSRVSGLRVSPDADRIAVFGVLETELEDFPTYTLEFISLTDGSRSLAADLPAGSVVAVDWMPNGERLVAAMVPPVVSNGSVLDEPCNDPTSLVFFSPLGEILAVLELEEPWDLRGGIAVLDEESAVGSALPPGLSCDPMDRRLVRIDLDTGQVEELGDIAGVAPVRGAGGVVFIRDRRLWFHDLESGATRAIETPGVRVLDAAASSRSVIVFRGYEETTGEDAGLYSVDIAVGPESLVFIMPTALNRLSLDESGGLLVGLRPAEKSYVAVIELRSSS